MPPGGSNATEMRENNLLIEENNPADNMETTTITRSDSRRWTFPLCISFVGAFLVYIYLSTDLTYIDRYQDRGNVYYNQNVPATAGIATAVSKGDNDSKVREIETDKEIDEETRTYRVGCREYPKGGESCVIAGIACIDIRKDRTEKDENPLVYLVDDTRKDHEVVESDLWCSKRHMSADPRYFGPREWPPVEYFAPRQSCLNAEWRTRKSLLPKNVTKVKWLEEFSLLNLDYVRNNHNNHYLMDIIWLLDVTLWQRSLSKSSTLPQEQRAHVPELFARPKYIVFPQTRSDFEEQTSRDVNRLNLAIVLGKNPSKLYRGQKREGDKLNTKPFLEAYPSMKKKFVFFGDEREDSSNDLICTKKLTVGAKLGNMGHERVCTQIRLESWKIFNITRPEDVWSSGFLKYHRPPRRVVLLQRHISRGIRNVEELTAALQKSSEFYDFEFEFHTTEETQTAEEQVKFFSRVGVLVTSHGSQAMGGIWMPRHGAIIEVFPPGYSDFSFDLLARACNLWHYEIRGIIPDELKEKYKDECKGKMNTLYDQCVPMKNEDVQTPIRETTEAVLNALRRLGHDLAM